MNKKFRKVPALLSAVAMAASLVTVPVTVGAAEYTPLVEGDTVLNEWKFDFGAEGATPEDGFTLVTPDRNYVTTKDYGFIGIDEESYKLGNRLDGFGNQKGQVIQLEAGGSAPNDGIGSTGEDDFGNAGDKYYPTRFALKTGDEKYFRVKATVTTLDPTKDASISLYTERKHPIFTERTVKAGETSTAEFTVRTTPIYYEKSTPTGSIADELVNVCVLGENSALASLEIQEIETAPVFWVLGDSTVTDGNCDLPFFPLQNYTGVGTGLTKYLPSEYAMVNEGEGGLNAADSNHYNMVKNRIKAGDYMYVEYGHNHKTDGATGYVSYLDKYYNTCHDAGANLIIVSPIERINTFSDGAYQHSLDSFATAGKEYVAEKVAAGATDIAYVELNQYSLDFYNKIVTDNGGDANAIKYYFQTTKGGGTDTTHPNDQGAENLAYEFVKASKAVEDATQKAVLAPIVNNYKDETPNLVSAEITAGGVGGTAWPIYVVPADEKYPVEIKSIDVDDTGAVTSVKVNVRAAEITFSTYGIIVITVNDADGNEKGKIYAKDQVDNSTGYGSQEIVSFTKDVTIDEGDTYTAVVLQADDTEDGLKVTDGGTVYSAVYTPTDIVNQLLLNEDGDGNEDFDYYGAEYDGETSSLNEYNGWGQIGSAGITLKLNQTDSFKYVEITSDGAKNGAANQGSFYVAKDLADTIGTKGRYVISADMQFVSGGGLTYNLVTGHNDKNMGGTASLSLFTVGDSGAVTASGQDAGTVSATEFTHVKYILDLDYGTGEITVGGSDPVTVDLTNYQTTDVDVTPAQLTQFMFGGSKVAFDVKVANLTVGQLKDNKLPEYTATAAANDDVRGVVSISAATPVPTDEPVEEEASAANLAADLMAADLMTYDNGVVKVDASVKGVLIEAAYDNGALKSVKTTDIDGEASVPVSAGSKIMLWDSINGMIPLCEAITAEAVKPTDAPTDAPTAAPTATPIPSGDKKTASAAMNTVITATAEANDGYVFMGWLNENGKLISEANPYQFRIREDVSLVANFVKEPGVEDIVTFALSADKANIKAEAGSTAQLSVIDAADAAGTPIEKATNADATWSCDEAGITVDANGLVTVGADFAIDANATKNVTVKAAINGIEKTYTLTLYSYAFYEKMSATTNFDGTKMTIAGKEAIVFPAASTTSTYDLGTTIDISKSTKITLSNAWTGTNTCGQARNLNFCDSDGNTVLTMYYSWTGLYVNEVALADAVAKDSWTDIVIEIDGTTATVTTAGGASGTVEVTGTSISQIKLASASSVPGPDQRALGFSELKVEQ